MELMHPSVLYIGIPVLVISCIVLHVVPAFRKKYMGGLRTGAAAIVKSLPLYKRIYIRKIILTIVNEAFVIAAIISALVLIARPYKVETVKTGVQKRDIFLNLDVSYSMYDLNYALADCLQEVVTELKGDRFGITMYNSASVVYVPLTDDYDYVVMRLEELKEYFLLQKYYWERYIYYEPEPFYLGDFRYESGFYFNDLRDKEPDEFNRIQRKLDYFEAGTLYKLDEKGGSLVGEGLGTCLYSFPSIGDSQRTRIIIMVTDNEKDSHTDRQIPTVNEAFELCKKNDVKVFAVYPNSEHFFTWYTGDDYINWSAELKRLTESTGGEFYVESESNTVSQIVEQIRSHEAMTVDDIITRQETDLPVPGMIALILCLAGSIICTTFLKGK